MQIHNAKQTQYPKHIRQIQTGDDTALEHNQTNFTIFIRTWPIITTIALELMFDPTPDLDLKLSLNLNQNI